MPIPPFIKAVDSEFRSGQNIGVDISTLEEPATFFMSFARWQNFVGKSSLIFHQSSISHHVSALGAKMSTAMQAQGINCMVKHTHQLESALGRWTVKSPIRPHASSIDTAMAEMMKMSALNTCFFLFSNQQTDAVICELTALSGHFGFSLIVGMPGILNYQNPFHVVFKQRGKELSVVKSYIGKPSTSPMRLTLDQDGFYIDDYVAGGSPSSADKQVLQQVLAELYDLRDCQAQKANQDKVKTLLAKYQQLNPDGRKRPAFMS